MVVKQLSVFVENKPGKILDIVDEIARSGFDLRALCIADTTDFGVLRVILDRPEDASRVLLEKGCIVRLTDVLAISMDDTPGSLAKILRALSGAGINVEYTYAFVAQRKGKAYVVVRVENNEKAIQVLTESHIELAAGEEAM
jgi:hypothetical protein